MKIAPAPLTRALACLVFTLLINAAPAAVILWNPVSTISGDSDVSTAGSLVNAFNVGGLGNATVGGITFTATTVDAVTTGTLGTGSGALTLQASTTWFGNLGAIFGSASAPFSSLSAGYQSLLNTLAYSASSSATYTMQGLVIGQAYLVQFWLNDSRGSDTTFGRYNQFTAGNLSGNVDVNALNAVGGVGQFVIGTFVADATTQAVNVAAGFVAPSTSSVIQLNGYQLRAIPEPSVAVLLTGSLLTLVLRRRRSVRSGIA